MVNQEQDADPIVEIATNKDRRNFLNVIPATLIATGITGINFPSTAFASDELALSLYEDENTGFQIKRPAEWTQSEQKLPDRRRLVLFQNNDEKYVEKDLMFIAYTPVRDDFTQLSSFGSVEQVGQMTILPKGELAGADSESAMLSAESKKNSYFFEYVTKSPGQPKRHFQTIFSLVQGATGGAGSVLVSITVQTTDDRYDILKNSFDDIIASYGKLKK